VPVYGKMEIALQPFYKYLPKKYADMLLNEGVIRIGTLFDYRRIEELGPASGDKKEGIVTQFFEASKRMGSTEEFPEFVTDNLNISGNIKMTAEPGFRLNVNRSTTDFYIFCASAKYDEKAMKEFGYDACIFVEKPKSFFRCLSRKMNFRSSFVGFFPCMYAPRDYQHTTKSIPNPALLKTPDYEYQNEVRAIWKPTMEGAIKPVTLTCKGLSGYCSAYPAGK
jgi:hypothetical protein